MNSSTNDKRQFIYDNISKIKNNQILYQLIEDNGIIHSKNRNGIYMNLSLLNDKLIHDIYTLIKQLLSHESKEKEYCINYDKYVNLCKNEESNKAPKPNQAEQFNKKYKILKLNKLQKEILNMI